MHNEREVKDFENYLDELVEGVGDGLTSVSKSLSVLPDNTLFKLQKLFQVTLDAVNEETRQRSLAKAKDAIRKEFNDLVFNEELNDIVSVCRSCGATDTKDVFSGHWTNTHKGWCLNK